MIIMVDACVWMKFALTNDEHSTHENRFTADDTWRSALVQHHDHMCKLMITRWSTVRPEACANLTVPMGYQIVNDGLLYDPWFRLI